MNVTVALPVSKAFWVQILLLPIMLEIIVSSGVFRSNDTFLLFFFLCHCNYIFITNTKDGHVAVLVLVMMTKMSKPNDRTSIL